MKTIVVIGGGIVGISTALALQSDGHDVTVIEPGPVGEGASWASCGCIAVGEIVPLSQPGLLAKVPGWLMNPTAPLAMRPSSALRVLPWFLQFAANARAHRMRAITADLARLTFRATADFKEQLAAYGVQDMLIERPIIKLFDEPKEKADMDGAFALARDYGCTIDEITGGEAHDIDPAIAPDFQQAAILRDWCFVANSVRLVKELTTAFAAQGGKLETTAALGFNTHEGGSLSLQLANSTSLTADEFVLAAGMGSKALTKDLNIKLPLEGLMGYWSGVSDPGVDLKHTVFYPAGGFGITPYENTLAVAGTIEIASQNAQPNWRRADVLVDRARRVLPGLKSDRVERRMGRRPFLPDTRPAIGRTKAYKNLILATGHGQLGVTLAATTGRLVSDIVANRHQNADLSAFSPDRF